MISKEDQSRQTDGSAQFIVIKTLHSQGLSIRQISRILCLNRRTVSKRLKEENLKPYPKKSYPSKLGDYKDCIEKSIDQAYQDRINTPQLHNQHQREKL